MEKTGRGSRNHPHLPFSRFFARRFDAESAFHRLYCPRRKKDMRVNGELYFWINGWMDFLCLILTACLARRRLRPARMTLAAALGALCAILAWMLPGWARGLVSLVMVSLLMTLTAFGKDGFRLWPLTVAAGLFFSGAADFLLDRGIPPAVVMIISGGIALGVAVILRGTAVRGRGEFRLRLTVNGKSATLPAFRDSGNLLTDGLTGLPVIVASETLLKPLLPPGVHPGDLSTLPKGWRLTRVQTAAGSKCLMCFQPDRACLIQGKVLRPLRAAVAVSDASGGRALLPEAIFMQEEGRIHADR